MECDRYPENGQGVASGALAWSGGVKRKLGGVGGLRLGPAGAGGLRLGAAGAGGARAGLLAPRRRPEPRPEPRAPLPRIAQDSPFMNNMDEITYWIVTKRAPCLAGYDNPLRAAASRALRSPSPDPEPKKKKRKLAPEDSSDTAERPNNYLTDQRKCEIISSENSDTLISDVDFNIKKSSVQEKSKKMKNQNNARTTLHKKNKVVTSTPKVISNLRRSMRKANNNNSHLNSSFEIFNTNPVNERMSTLAGGDHSNKRNSTPAQKITNGALNEQFEDMSDVSGFTANYIKSTKINSKTPKKLRAKPSRNLAKESRQNAQAKEEKSLIVSINKAMNTGDPKAIVFNCSTDSSQNIINIVSIDKDSKPNQLDKSTSLLKFMDSKKVVKDISSKEENRNGINTSFQSTSTIGSRYPKRHKTFIEVTTQDNSEQTEPSKQSSRRPTSNSLHKLVGPICVPSENTDVLSRTRSGRSIGATKHPENSVFVLSNSTEQVSSVATMNVASPVQNEHRDSQKKKRLSSKSVRARKSLNKTGQSAKDSFREKSGFAACFSDSDDDKPLKPQKYLS
ncbi:uncharacterized protein isoform X2 [Choristoneura fumiferana]|uniref:uncharacterized protein isoform X2 n=1 Tax=Choristoneura fumiferana TaxID=7141 RepID=UPI003D15412F